MKFILLHRNDTYSFSNTDHQGIGWWTEQCPPRDSNPPDLIGSLPIWCIASRSPDFYQILPIYHKILKTRGKLLIFRIFGDLSLWNTHIILTFFAKSIMVCYNSGRNDVKIQEMALERT